jgi:hypothetical protein
MKKILSVLILSTFAVSAFSQAQITDFVNKSSQQKIFLDSDNQNILSGLNEAKEQFVQEKTCLSSSRGSQSFSGEVVGVINKSNENIYLVKTDNGLKYFKEENNKNTKSLIKVGSFVKNKQQASFC